jgi:hypothetical protein
MKTKMGRPKKSQDKVRAPGISIRLTADESKIISDAVNRSTISRKTEWARKALIYVASNATICIT